MWLAIRISLIPGTSNGTLRGRGELRSVNTRSITPYTGDTTTPSELDFEALRTSHDLCTHIISAWPNKMFVNRQRF